MKNIIITTYYLRTIGLSMGNQHSNLLPKSIHDVVDSRTGSIDMLSALLYLRRQKRALQDDLDNALDDAYALASQEYE